VLWKQAVHAYTEVTENRLDIIIENRKEKTCTLIDVAISAERNVVQKEAEKKLKYKSFGIEIQRMWDLECTIIPVIANYFFQLDVHFLWVESFLLLTLHVSG
jgi:HD-like signal output (HDOD) protein